MELATVINVPMDAEARNLVSSIVYKHWSECFDRLKAAKAATWEQNKQVCPKGDWKLFHQHQLDHAQKELDKAASAKDQVCMFAPYIYGS